MWRQRLSHDVRAGLWFYDHEKTSPVVSSSRTLTSRINRRGYRFIFRSDHETELFDWNMAQLLSFSLMSWTWHQPSKMLFSWHDVPMIMLLLLFSFKKNTRDHVWSLKGTRVKQSTWPTSTWPKSKIDKGALLWPFIYFARNVKHDLQLFVNLFICNRYFVPTIKGPTFIEVTVNICHFWIMWSLNFP